VILKEISSIRGLMEASPFSRWTHPIREYIKVSSSFVPPQTQDNANLGYPGLGSDSSNSTLAARSTEGSCGENSSERGSEDKDMADIMSFESFDSWLASFGVPANTLSLSPPSTDQVNEDGRTRPASSLRDTPILSLSTVELHVQNLPGPDPSGGRASPSEQKISLAPLDPLWKAIQEIQDRGSDTMNPECKRVSNKR
jgi:hypothetical protein